MHTCKAVVVAQGLLICCMNVEVHVGDIAHMKEFNVFNEYKLTNHNTTTAGSTQLPQET